MLSNEMKRELRIFFNISNITTSKKKDGFNDVNEYYRHLLIEKQDIETIRNEIERQKEKEKEETEKQSKKKLRNKLKKIRKRINKKISENDTSDDDDDDIEIEQIKPYIFFIPQIQTFFDENLYIIGLLNQHYDSNEKYKEFLETNNYEKIKITRHIHRGFTDEQHFNGYFLTRDDKTISTCIHFYVENDTIKKLSRIVEI